MNPWQQRRLSHNLASLRAAAKQSFAPKGIFSDCVLAVDHGFCMDSGGCAIANSGFGLKRGLDFLEWL